MEKWIIGFTMSDNREEAFIWYDLSDQDVVDIVSELWDSNKLTRLDLLDECITFVMENLDFWEDYFHAELGEIEKLMIRFLVDRCAPNAISDEDLIKMEKEYGKS